MTNSPRCTGCFSALFPGEEGSLLNDAPFEGARSRQADLLPGEDALSRAVRVVDVTDIPGRAILTPNANAPTRRVACCLERGGGAVVHDGIVENHALLREELRSRGHRFASETDTGVIARLVEENPDEGVLCAMRRALTALIMNSVPAAVPLQLFAYHMAAARGPDVDRPRNLAKSVTVE